MPTSLIGDVKDKATPKTAKGAANKERESTAPQQHSEPDNAETVHGLSRDPIHTATSHCYLFR